MHEPLAPVQEESFRKRDREISKESLKAIFKMMLYVSKKQQQLIVYIYIYNYLGREVGL